MQNVVVLGCTGSIGVNTLDVIHRAGGLKVIGLGCKGNVHKLSEQIEKFKPKYVYIEDIDKSNIVKNRYRDVQVFNRLDGVDKLIAKSDVDIVVNAVVGSAGLVPTYYSISFKKKLALANKESLVVAGRILKEMASKSGIEIVPIDSEHSAIYQCLEGRNKSEVEKIILTASGGPFLDKSFENATIEDALDHPNWNMGKKITVDSATMMNKGFEIIEARWLFDIKDIEVVIHPESIVHSAVEFIDGSIIAQVADHDMRIPIAYALTKPKRIKLPFKVDLTKIGKLTFIEPDYKKFPTLDYAFEAMRKEDKNCGLVLNLADEIAVENFLQGKIRFVDIFKILELSLRKFEDRLPRSMDGIFRMIGEVKEDIEKIVELDIRRT